MYARLNDSNVFSLVLTMPLSGIWTASIESDSDLPLSGSITLEIGGVATLKGSIVRGDSIHGRFNALIVGGAGCLGKVLSAKAYASAPYRLILEDIAKDSGETLDASINLGSCDRWIRRKTTASDAIRELAQASNSVWRVLPNGSLWVGQDSYPSLKCAPTLIESIPSDRAEVLACEDALITPGSSVGGRRVKAVVHTIESNTFRSKVFYHD